MIGITLGFYLQPQRLTLEDEPPADHAWLTDAAGSPLTTGPDTGLSPLYVPLEG